MLDQLKIGNILFLDVETVPAYASFDLVPDNFRMLWEKKATYLKKETETPEELYNRAGIYAEFGKIVCISTGMIGIQDDKRVFRLKSFFMDDEIKLLTEFSDLLTRLSQKREIDLCAHNGKEFDFEFSQGDSLYLPYGIENQFVNTGNKELVILYSITNASKTRE